MELKCEHRNRDYTYDLTDKTQISLCSACNMNLASGVMAQLALEVFIDS